MDSRKEDRIIILHEYGSNSHYNGLSALCEQNGICIEYYEFRFIHLIGSGIEHRNLKRILKQPKNFLFLLTLLFTRNKNIVLGMFPYDWRLPVLSLILRKHNIYYHSSYTTWYPDEMDKTRNASIRQQQRIKRFVSQHVKHVFAVTEKARDSICRFTGIDKERVSVVYHSYNIDLSKSVISPPLSNFIYVGRMDIQKGVDEMCDYFSKHPELSLTLVGDGDYTSYIKNMINSFSNIKYVGYVKGLNNLMPIYNQNAYFILNSKRTSKWEELFGQVIIESMACGCVPICVNHSGPKEIITNNVNGFLFDEEGFFNIMDYVQYNVDAERYSQLRKMAYIRGHEFESSKIASRWEPILKYK